jgi:hypothetical protein
MTNAERLRTRLMVAAQKFATEVADAVLEATGDREEADETPRRKRRAPERAPAVVKGDVDPVAAARAQQALAKLGIRTG